MARGRGVAQNGRSKKRPFISIPWDVYDTLAKKGIKPPARTILFHLIRLHNGVNNGKIGFAVRKAAKLGLSQATASRGLRELANAGFITVETRSGFNQKGRTAAEYGLAWLPIDGRTPTLGYRDIPKPEIKHSSTTDADSFTTDAAGGRKAA